jgi:hypothetical protein
MLSILSFFLTWIAMQVLAHWNLRCAQLGDLWNRPPTGAVEEISGMTRFVIVKNKISRIESFRDKMQQEMASADYYGL